MKKYKNYKKITNIKNQSILRKILIKFQNNKNFTKNS